MLRSKAITCPVLQIIYCDSESCLDQNSVCDLIEFVCTHSEQPLVIKITGILIALVKALFFSPKVLIFFLFLHENIFCGYSLETPRQGASNEYPQHMFSWRNKKTIKPDTHSYLDLCILFHQMLQNPAIKTTLYVPYLSRQTA